MANRKANGIKWSDIIGVVFNDSRTQLWCILWACIKCNSGLPAGLIVGCSSAI